MKRKLFKLLVLTIVCSIFVYVIYIFCRQNKINYVVLGDYLGEGYSIYVKKHLEDNHRLREYNNYSVRGETVNSLDKKIDTTASIKKDLREAKLVTISIGLEDFYDNLTISVDTTQLLELKKDIEKLLPKLDKVLNSVRKYAKYDVILIGYYNPVPFLFNTNSSELDVLFMYIDGMVKGITKKYDITYISLYSVFKNNDYVGKFFPNNSGYKAISKEIINHVKQN